MNSHSAAKWEQRRKIGKSKFILYFGVLGFGISVALLLTLFEYVTVQQITYVWVVMRLLLFPIVGFFIAHSRWDKLEQSYALYTKKP
jgi:phosphate/sulfate permease